MKNGYTIIELLMAMVGLFLGIGWLINIYKVVGMFSSDVTAELILRVVGIFVVPFGGIMGWM